MTCMREHCWGFPFMFNPDCQMCIQEQRDNIKEFEKRGKDSSVPKMLLEYAKTGVMSDDLKILMDIKDTVKATNKVLEQLEQIEI